MYKAFFITLIIIGGLVAFTALAANPFASKFTFPIVELGNCGSQEACRAYCDQSDHVDACISWAEQQGLVDKNEAKVARKVIKQGGPGGCKSEESCRAYCAVDANFKACMKFAKDNQLLSSAEVEKAEKLQGLTGPGGCKGRECKEYCHNPENQEACFKFAKENNLIPPEEVQRIKEANQRFAENLQQAPEAVRECLRQSLGEDPSTRLQNSDSPPRELGKQMQICFQQFNEKRREQFETEQNEQKERRQEFEEKSETEREQMKEELDERKRFNQLQFNKSNADSDSPRPSYSERPRPSLSYTPKPEYRDTDYKAEPKATHEFQPRETIEESRTPEKSSSLWWQVQAIIARSLFEFLR